MRSLARRVSSQRAITTPSPAEPAPVRVRQRLGKYRIRKRLAEGGFATVYHAYDTIEGLHVALKIPHRHLFAGSMNDVMRREVRLLAKLEHPNVLPLKNATRVDGHFLIATPLGERSLDDRLGYRLGPQTALEYAAQLLDALAYAHEQRVVHCDIKPDNVILFADGRLRLGDFGIAKVLHGAGSRSGSGTGTVGYIAPEQAMGRVSFRSDVFSTGLVLYRMFSGALPEWPFASPLPGRARLRRNLDPAFIAFLERSIAVDEKKRYRDGIAMRNAFQRVAARALRRPRTPRASTGTRG